MAEGSICQPEDGIAYIFLGIKKWWNCSEVIGTCCLGLVRTLALYCAGCSPLLEFGKSLAQIGKCKYK